MTANKIREQFLEFFRSKQHAIVQSSPVIPFDDPTLLFANAGMNQFKDVFLGTGKRDYKRAANTQKCIRVSGKHNDLEEVGHDTYHHTFFEMLGNWSFGDYYKNEAIEWAWELLTEVWKLPKERLWATVFNDDDEAFKIWNEKTDIKSDHILRFGEKDNFWEMGDTGPCGPCSEIHINIGNDFDNPEWVNAGSPECIEIWNLVFIQFEKDKEGNLKELPQKHIDTGMGFERICAVIQKKSSNYDTDIFIPIINKISEISGMKEKNEEMDIAKRVIADHIRTLTFAIADGAIPGNEGRGYVLRRILRRAYRYGRKLNLNNPFLYKLVETVIQEMGEVFPEITLHRKNIENIIKGEETSFNDTLDRGIQLFEEIANTTEKNNKKLISGDDVFKLYDTFGFPSDLTRVMAKERGLEIEEKRFDILMEEQKERARKSTKDKLSSVNISEITENTIDLKKIKPTEFTGYDEFRTESQIMALENINDKSILVLDKTPFYVESGGQVSDSGKIIIGSSSHDVAEIVKTKNHVLHLLNNSEDEHFNRGDSVIAEIDSDYRWHVMRNHSATHFIHAALREILGIHVKQAGSYVGPDRLRFDFSHYKKVSEAELKEIEIMVNEKLRSSLELKHHRNINFEDAKKMGALMFFGDKYGEKVNVVQFGDYTMEFCGGTHVKNSSQIGLFKIISESSIASGVRRIEAVTGFGTQEYLYSQIDKLRDSNQRIEELIAEKNRLEKELSGWKLTEKVSEINLIAKSPEIIDDVNIYKGRIDVANMDELKSMGDELRNSIKSGVGVLISEIGEKAGIVCIVSDDLRASRKLEAGKIVGQIAKILGGGGGGKSHLATAGGKDISKIEDALKNVENVVKQFLN